VNRFEVTEVRLSGSLFPKQNDFIFLLDQER